LSQFRAPSYFFLDNPEISHHPTRLVYDCSSTSASLFLHYCALNQLLSKLKKGELTMVKWTDIHPSERASFTERLAGRYKPPFEQTPWVEAPDLVNARVGIVTTAAMHRFDDRPFTGHAGDYRIIPGDIDYKDLSMSHSSTNFDRSAYQQDVNVCFPLDHLRTLVQLGEIKSVSDWHYSFMGSTAPELMEPAAREVSKLLLGDNVNLVLLIPV
jgi:D-proline reductase (dithiol) PrdB